MDEAAKKSPAKQNTGWMGRFAGALKKNRKLEFVFYIGIALLVLAIYFSTLLPEREGEKAASGASAESGAVSTEREVEERLASVLSGIKGVGRVQVMITFETGPELVTAMNVDTNTSKTYSSGDEKQNTTEQQTESRKPATVNSGGGTAPIVLLEKLPSVRGVIVVAEGAADISVRLNLQKAVQTVLDVPAQCIEVFEGYTDATNNHFE